MISAAYDLVGDLRAILEGGRMTETTTGNEQETTTLTLADLQESIRKVNRITAEANGLESRPNSRCPMCDDPDVYYGVVIPLARPHFLVCCSCKFWLNW